MDPREITIPIEVDNTTYRILEALADGKSVDDEATSLFLRLLGEHDRDLEPHSLTVGG